jgi:hypothetical protein
MKIITKTDKRYSTNHTMVYVVDSRKRKLPLFGVWKEKDRFGIWYKSDTHGRVFHSMKDVKTFASNYAIQEFGKYL